MKIFIFFLMIILFIGSCDNKTNDINNSQKNVGNTFGLNAIWGQTHDNFRCQVIPLTKACYRNDWIKFKVNIQNLSGKTTNVLVK